MAFEYKETIPIEEFGIDDGIYGGVEVAAGKTLKEVAVLNRDARRIRILNVADRTCGHTEPVSTEGSIRGFAVHDGEVVYTQDNVLFTAPIKLDGRRGDRMSKGDRMSNLAKCDGKSCNSYFVNGLVSTPDRLFGLVRGEPFVFVLDSQGEFQQFADFKRFFRDYTPGRDRDYFVGGTATPEGIVLLFSPDIDDGYAVNVPFGEGARTIKLDHQGRAVYAGGKFYAPVDGQILTSARDPLGSSGLLHAPDLYFLRSIVATGDGKHLIVAQNCKDIVTDSEKRVEEIKPDLKTLELLLFENVPEH